MRTRRLGTAGQGIVMGGLWNSEIEIKKMTVAL